MPEPENRESHTVLLGPWGGNKCCHCCDRCTGRDAEAQNEYNNCTGCPPLCCTCPPLCDLEVTITATCCDGLNGQTITISASTLHQSFVGSEVSFILMRNGPIEVNVGIMIPAILMERTLQLVQNGCGDKISVPVHRPITLMVLAARAQAHALLRGSLVLITLQLFRHVLGHGCHLVFAVAIDKDRQW